MVEGHHYGTVSTADHLFGTFLITNGKQIIVKNSREKR
jgi:hypothetical protein